VTTAPDPLPPERLRPLRRAEYDRLVGLGMFESEKLELLHGRLVSMNPQGEAHSFSIRRMNRLLVLGLRDRADVCVQLPFVASDFSEPEPDLAVVPPGDYLDGHPQQAYLVIEVAESSLAEDRKIKSPLYATAGVPEYWIVNLVDRVVEVYREPRDGAYALVSRHDRDAVLTVPGFADVTIAVGEVVPPHAR
jgi:Uma2 family endonuclease